MAWYTGALLFFDGGFSAVMAAENARCRMASPWRRVVPVLPVLPGLPVLLCSVCLGASLTSDTRLDPAALSRGWRPTAAGKVRYLDQRVVREAHNLLEYTWYLRVSGESWR